MSWLTELKLSDSVGVPDSLLEIEGGASEGKQLLTLDQNDTDQPFIKFEGTLSSDVTTNISDLNGAGSVTGPKDELSGEDHWHFRKMFLMRDEAGNGIWFAGYSPHGCC